MTLAVQQRSTAAAGVGSRIGLNELITCRVGIASTRAADDSQIHRAFATEGIAEHHGQIPNANFVGITQGQERERPLRGYLQNGQIDLAIRSDDSRREPL